MNTRDWIQFFKGVGIGALIVTLAILAMVILSVPAKAEPRLIYIDDEITMGSIAPIEKELQARVDAGPKGGDLVEMVIDSPGGSVIAGNRIVNLMAQLQAEKIQIHCYVTNVAASMAFQILTQCNKRYAMVGSFLLWHGVRMQTNQPITAELAQTIADDMRRLNKLILFQLRGALSLTDKEIAKHFLNETLWTGYTLHSADPGFIELKKGYPWLVGRLKTAVKTAPPQMFFFGNSKSPVEYVYTWKGYPRKVKKK